MMFWHSLFCGIGVIIISIILLYLKSKQKDTIHMQFRSPLFLYFERKTYVIIGIEFNSIILVTL